MGNSIIRGFIAFILIGITLFLGFWMMLVAAFSVSKGFYVPLVLIVTLLLVVWIIIALFRLLKSKIIWFSLLGIVLVCAVSISVYEGYRSYIKSIPTVDDQGVNLYDYQPFSDGSKVAKLSEQSAFLFTDSLPVLDGATALYPVYAAFAQATYPRGEYNPYNSIVSSHTTPEAYDNLLSGVADIIFCAAPSRSQVEKAAALGIEYSMTPIGKEAFVFFVNAKNPVSELTIEQIQDVYSGKKTNWNELGGKDEEIKAFQRPVNSGSQTMLEKIMEDKELMSPPTNDIAGGMGEIIDRTAEYKNFNNAIGYTFLFFATEMIGNNQIKLIKVNGVYPDKNTIENNTYPFTGDFYAITTGANNKNVTNFVNWILSEQGQYLIEKTGYTPINKATEQ
ncbi:MULTISPECIES: PstS family phosphate ABC transporter substrate-binding protein [Dysgonomonas]|uniref:PBP domain-containing protein n=1 Tax=Dysgonomonas gadei ATCC BAA-286 TaxID=742766 RepID=F5J3Z9_9BACT|nr:MULTISPECIES: substrate-binding domain-containing protein [Dysgonomonas]EGJ99570.1 hypothetical protein HMPREF9455_04066 [Dysgonomonas gadei ATCC BAA-286]MBF0650920.1 substrate-binding domain-containing protein [Dysgonomonas sp. GY75]